MAKKTIPPALIQLVPGLINSVVSIIRDKRNENLESNTELVNKEIADGVSISSKRALNVAGTGVIITFALQQMVTHGISWMNLCVLLLGVFYCFGLTWLTYVAEKQSVNKVEESENKPQQ